MRMAMGERDFWVGMAERERERERESLGVYKKVETNEQNNEK